MNKTFCVISHTHWDREWYLTQEEFRMKLVDLIDNLLVILGEYPHYIFHLDAQTIVLDDYLEIRPYKREALRGYIKENRLLVGPWYVQNDFYLTSGEATVRNLLIGSETAHEMGGCTWVGYTPDQFGLISQLPQILRGFEMDNCIFGRGYDFYKKFGEELVKELKPSEFIWRGADGSEVFAVQMTYWYNNAQRFSEDMEKSLKLLKHIENSFEGVACTPYLLLMNGVDHLEAQENLIPILEKAQKALEDNKIVYQCNMQQYLENAKSYIKENGIRLDACDGELRYGMDYHVLQGTLSSRIYLKTANVKAQSLLENRLEILYSMLYGFGAPDKYPYDYMKYLWKLLIQNHPHDSICGCSNDEVHRHMEDRFERVCEVGNELTARGIKFLALHATREKLDQDDYMVAVFNPTQADRKGIVELNVQFPVTENVEGFDIIDYKSNKLSYAVLSHEKTLRKMLSPINLPGSKEVDSYRVQLATGEIPGLGYSIYRVRPLSKKIEFLRENIELCLYEMDNEKIKVTVRKDGKVDLLYKETGKQYNNIITLEDVADAGDSYIYGKVQNDLRITTEDMIPDIFYIRNTEFSKTICLSYNIMLPESYDVLLKKRSEVRVINRVEVFLTLNAASEWLEVEFRVDNRSEDHRLRVLFNTGYDTDLTYSSSPFDVYKRDRKDELMKIQNGTIPNSGFIDIGDSNEGAAILNTGLYEYEHIPETYGTVALTLVRATNWIHKSEDGQAESMMVPENQCKRQLVLHTAIYPHKGNYSEGNVAVKALEYLNPIQSLFEPVDGRKFMGGRPAVQDTSIGEIFYRQVEYPQLQLPYENRLLKIYGKDIVLSALKRAERNSSLIVRVYNTSNEIREMDLEYCKPISQAYLCNLNEKAIRNIGFDGEMLEKLVLKPKEIATLMIV